MSSKASHPTSSLFYFGVLISQGPEHEFTFITDINGLSYKGDIAIVIFPDPYIRDTVLTSSPPIPTLPVLVNALSESKDIYLFIMQMCQAFVKLVNP